MSAKMLERCFAILFLFAMAVITGSGEAAEAIQFPRFRHIDKAATTPQVTLPATLVLLADEDFAPFSFKTIDGRFSGLSVQLALGVCEELRVQCQVRGLPFVSLRTALQQNQGDVIIGGPLAPMETASSPASTKAYFYSFSAFFMRRGTKFTATDTKSLAGQRIGFVRSSVQEMFLRKYYDRAMLVPFASEAAMFDALRTSTIDLAYADFLHGNFWLKGAASEGCCVQLGGAFTGPISYGRGLVMLTRPQDEGLRDMLDYALDRLQEKGLSARIFATYLPASPF